MVIRLLAFRNAMTATGTEMPLQFGTGSDRGRTECPGQSANSNPYIFDLLELFTVGSGIVHFKSSPLLPCFAFEYCKCTGRHAHSMPSAMYITIQQNHNPDASKSSSSIQTLKPLKTTFAPKSLCTASSLFVVSSAPALHDQ